MAERILLKALDGSWEVLGVDRDPGITPEAVSPTWNAWGPDGLTFTLKRDPSLTHGDLHAFTPVRWEVDGRLLWSGFTIDRPGGEDSLTVTCLGWQHHLDDDVYSAGYVNGDLSAWVDTRSLPSFPTQLARFVTEPTVTTGGSPSLVFGKGSNLDPDDCAGITFDCGPDPDTWPTAFDVKAEAIGTGLTANIKLYLRLSDSVETIVGGVLGEDRHDAISSATAIPGGGWGGGLLSIYEPRRFLTLMLVRDGASAPVPAMGSDEGIRFTVINLYRDSAYRAGGASSLKVSSIVKDALTHAPLLDQAVDEVASTGLNIPQADWRNEDRTPREAMEQFNAYHRWQLKVDARAKLVYRAIPARATLRVSAGRGARWVEGSAQSGRELYNRVVIRGASGAGVPLKVVRLTSDLPGSALISVGAPQPVNPTAAVDAGGWTSGTITRDTTEYRTAPASIKFESTGVGSSPVGAFPAGQVFRGGVTYVLTLHARGPALGRGLTFGVLGVDVANTPLPEIINLDATFQAMSVAWTPKTDRASEDVTIRTNKLDRVGGGPNLWIDDVVVTSNASSLIDRRGFLRTKILNVGSPTDPAAMTALGDAFLTLAMRTPLKGNLEIGGDDVVTELITGRPVPASDLGALTGELILLDNLVDPDFGGFGRVGTMAAATHSAGVASLVIDNARDNFEALLARMGIVAAK